MVEGWRYVFLLKMQREGKISGLDRQVSFALTDGCYIADFVYQTPEGRIVEDVKSPITANLRVFRNKQKEMKQHHGVLVKVVFLETIDKLDSEPVYTKLAIDYDRYIFAHTKEGRHTSYDQFSKNLRSASRTSV